MADEPCDWPVSYAACQAGGEVFETPEDQATFEKMAATYLWNWTDRQFTLCETTIRPCRSFCNEAWSAFDAAMGLGSWQWTAFGSSAWTPVMIAGKWRNLYCGGCGGLDCSCGAVPHINLPGPVDSVTEVQIDGEVVPSSTYRLEGSMLIRENGLDWPDCQDLALPLGQEGTWGVTYMRGKPVPKGGQIAAGVLATELYKAACNDASCKLPQRVQTITRQGVTMAMLDSFEDSVDKGYTGIWVIDSWLSSVNSPKQPSVVQSPDYNYYGGRGKVGR